MPTGYTHKIAEGITFEQFALGCARAIAYLITMRDEPSDAPIPESFEADDYHVRELEAAKARLARLRSLTEADAGRQAAEKHEEALAAHKKHLRVTADLRTKYVEMLTRVNAWRPPTPEHNGLKRFMREQLEQSIEYDTDYEPPPPECLGGEEWRRRALKEAEESVEYHEKAHAKEVEHAAACTAWVAALRDSLKEKG